MKIQGYFAKIHTIVCGTIIIILMSLLFSSSNNQSPETFMFCSGLTNSKLALKTNDCQEQPDAFSRTCVHYECSQN